MAFLPRLLCRAAKMIKEALMVDLKAKPFELTDEQIRWVEDTLADMTLE